MDNSLKQLDDLINEINKDIESCDSTYTLNDTIIDSPTSPLLHNKRNCNVNDVLYKYINKNTTNKNDIYTQTDNSLDPDPDPDPVPYTCIDTDILCNSWPVGNSSKKTIGEKIIKYYKKKLSRK
jgi:hypothetical protein